MATKTATPIQPSDTEVLADFEKTYTLDELIDMLAEEAVDRQQFAPPVAVAGNLPTVPRQTHKSAFEIIEEAIAAHGWQYDTDNEQFIAEGRPLEFEAVLRELPGLTFIELASYQDAQFAARSARCRGR